MSWLKTLAIVIILLGLSLSIAEAGDLTVSGNTTTSTLTLSSLDCTANLNGGSLTANASGVVSCTDDDAGNTLDGAYDHGGDGAGRVITTDAGAVVFEGAGGVELDTGNLLQTPGNPVLVGSLAIGTSVEEVFVSGRYAYVVDDGSDDLKVIDVTDPRNPELVGSMALGTQPRSVFVSGRYAYVIDLSSNDLKVIDVSDPSAPVLAGSLVFGSLPYAVFVSGRYAYVADGGSDNLIVIDVSDPGNPSLAGSLALGPQPRSVYVFGPYAYVVDSESNDLKVIDVSDPANPALAGSLVVGDTPFDAVVSGRYAYVAESASDELRVVDVSDPGAMALVGSVDTGSFPRTLTLSGSYVYVTDGSKLQVIDVFDPTTPVLVGTLTVGSIPISVAVSGRFAYVVDSNSDDLKVIDLSGAEVTGLMAHSLEAGSLQVRNDIIAQGQLQVRGGANIGSGGLFSDGDAGFAQNVDIIGDLTVVGSCTGCSSDARLKQNIRPMDNALDRISQLRGVTYDWRKDVREAHYYPGAQVGVLGQDVAAVFPELVGTDTRGYQFVHYSKLVAPLIEAVKELKQENDELKRRLERLEQQSK